MPARLIIDIATKPDGEITVNFSGPTAMVTNDEKDVIEAIMRGIDIECAKLPNFKSSTAGVSMTKIGRG